MAKPVSLFSDTHGSEKSGPNVGDMRNIIKMEFDCRPGAKEVCKEAGNVSAGEALHA